MHDDTYSWSTLVALLHTVFQPFSTGALAITIGVVDLALLAAQDMCLWRVLCLDTTWLVH
jgi:hypothetical protein